MELHGAVTKIVNNICDAFSGLAPTSAHPRHPSQSGTGRLGGGKPHADTVLPQGWESKGGWASVPSSLTLEPRPLPGRSSPLHTEIPRYSSSVHPL